MSFEVKSTQFEVTPAIAEHAEKSAAKLSKLKVETSYNQMNLKKDGSNFVAEYEIKTKAGNFFAHDANVDCYKAITNVVAKVYEQVHRKLDRINDNH